LENTPDNRHTLHGNLQTASNCHQYQVQNDLTDLGFRPAANDFIDPALIFSNATRRFAYRHSTQEQDISTLLSNNNSLLSPNGLENPQHRGTPVH
jgi:hypothetical protein